MVTVFGASGLTATVQSTADTAISVRLDLAAAAAPGERILFIDTAGARQASASPSTPPAGQSSRP